MLAGQHVSRVELPYEPGIPSCTPIHVLVPVRKTPPLVNVYTWTGECAQELGPGDLQLQDDEAVLSISPVCRDTVNVWVRRISTEENRIITYKVLLSSDPILWQYITAQFLFIIRCDI